MGLKIDQQNEVINLTKMVQVDGTDLQVMGKLQVRYDKGDFRIRFNMLSSMGDESAVLEAMADIMEVGTRMGEEKLDAWRGTLGAGKQTDLFATAEAA